MALTFGTLLSSQGADAHHPGPFGPIRGNLSNFTRSDPPGQTWPSTARHPTWSPHTACRGASRLGARSTRPICARTRWPGCSRWLLASNKVNT